MTYCVYSHAVAIMALSLLARRSNVQRIRDTTTARELVAAATNSAAQSCRLMEAESDRRTVVYTGWPVAFLHNTQPLCDHRSFVLHSSPKYSGLELHTIRYDTRCYFNVRSKANMSQLNLPHGTDNKKCKNRKKTKSRKQVCPEITVNSPGNPCSKYLSRKQGRATVGRICREGRF